jgi:hypothetical protein
VLIVAVAGGCGGSSSKTTGTASSSASASGSASSSAPASGSASSTAAGVQFGGWGERVTVNGAPKVTVSSASTFQHCRSQPLIRLTANYKQAGIAASTPVGLDWSHNGAALQNESPAPWGGQPVVQFFIGPNPAGFPDGTYKAVLTVNGKPALTNALAVTTTGC